MKKALPILAAISCLTGAVQAQNVLQPQQPSAVQPPVQVNPQAFPPVGSPQLQNPSAAPSSPENLPSNPTLRVRPNTAHLQPQVNPNGDGQSIQPQEAPGAIIAQPVPSAPQAPVPGFDSKPFPEGDQPPALVNTQQEHFPSVNTPVGTASAASTSSDDAQQPATNEPAVESSQEIAPVAAPQPEKEKVLRKKGDGSDSSSVGKSVLSPMSGKGELPPNIALSPEGKKALLARIQEIESTTKKELNTEASRQSGLMNRDGTFIRPGAEKENY